MPAPPTWTFVLTDLHGAVLGELIGATDRQVSLPLNRLPSAQFKIPLWHPLAQATMSQDCLLKAYRRDVLGTQKLVFCGPIRESEETGDALNQSIAVSAAGPFIRLIEGRIIGLNKEGIRYPPTGMQNLSTTVSQILATANGRPDGYTGIDFGTVTGIDSIATAGVGPYILKSAGEAIAEIAVGLNHFDWEVAPVEPAAGRGFPKIGELNMYPAGGLGDMKPNAILEYGTPRANVTSYNRKMARNYANRIHVPASGETALPLVTREDPTSQQTHGEYEVVVNDAGVIDTALREKIGDEHLKYRANPHNIVTFTPAMNARPAIFTDYIVGDSIRARAVVRNSIRFDAMFRIWGATFSIDSNGNESLDLQLVQE